jgi:hypothetical protein
LPALITADPLIDDVLAGFREAIARDFAGYRGHVYRTFNFACALSSSAGAARDLAVVAVFHDIGIWSAQTFDYLAPSAEAAGHYVRSQQPALDEGAVRRMIWLHHKLTPCSAEDGAHAEAFRRADLIDLTFGLVEFGLPGEFIREVRSVFPNAGFHRCLLRVAARWVRRHPGRPLPMLFPAEEAWRSSD